MDLAEEGDGEDFHVTETLRLRISHGEATTRTNGRG